MSSRQRDPFPEWLGSSVADRVGGDHWEPAADVFETETAIVVRFEISGVSKDQIHVSVQGDTVRIRGERTPRLDHDVERLHQVEIAFGPFERRVRVTVPFDREQVAAQLEEGFLRVVLPKRSPGPHKVEVETEPDPGPERE